MTSDRNQEDVIKQLEAAKDRLAAAASVGYEASMTARAEVRALEAEMCASMPVVYVVGNTYKRRAALKRLGLKWDAGHHAWTGRVSQEMLPSGCRIVSKSEAALLSMDHEYSAY